MTSHRNRLRPRDDHGVALITAIMFLAVIGALATAATAVAVSAAQNSNRDRQAGGALATAEAGVAQAVQVLHSKPAGYFTCMEPAPGASPSGACLTNPAGWTSSASPEKVSADGTVGACTPSLACYAVWIGTVSSYTPTSGFGQYRIHSTGFQGGGPAARSVVVDAKASPEKFPIGVYSDDASTGGTFGINHESLFTKGCLTHRVFEPYDANGVPAATSSGGGISFSGIDAQYGIPAAAHAVQYITQANSGCSSASVKSPNQANVHDPAQKNADTTPWSPCNQSDYYDQDAQGGPVSGTPCATAWKSGSGYPTTSKFTMADLASYGYRDGGLSSAEYAQLETTAGNEGLRFTTTSTSGLNAALSAGNLTNPVVFFDLAGTGGTVTLKPGDIPSQYFRPTNDTSSCPNLNSIIFVVRGGNMVYNSSGLTPGPLVASIFVPDGSYSGQGGATIIGTLFAKTLTGTGTQNWYLDQCFVNNPPGPVMSVQELNYREVDTQNVN